MSNRFRIKALAAAIGMVAAASLCAAPSSGAATNNVSLRTVRHATRLHAGDKVLGLLSQSKPMQVAVSLKLRNKAQLDAFIANPHHPNLTPAQFRATYAPTQAQGSLQTRLLDDLIHKAFAGSGKDLVLAALRGGRVSDAEREEIQRFLGENHDD